MKLHIIFMIAVVFVKKNEVQSLNILGIFPHQGKSHFFVFERYLKELAGRGHNMTVISYFPQNQPSPNYHDIKLDEKVKILEDLFPVHRSYMTIFKISLFLLHTGTENCRILLANERVQDLWKSNHKFDVVVTEQFNSDCSLGLAYKLGAPVVGITTHAVMPWHFDRFGIPNNPSYVSSMFLGGGTKPTLYQRLERTFFDIYFNFIYKLYAQRVDQNTLAQYFSDIPPLENLAHDMKFLLLYTHFIHFGSNILPTNIIEVGGYHVAEPKKLPEDIRQFIEESENGVIYISFGSLLNMASTPVDKIETIISAISELPQRVIWKWEEKRLPGNPKNIYFSNWLPQNDILAHPNVLAFLSHCGMLGTTEAFHHGVPIVAMPIFGDQPANAAGVEESGIGVQIHMTELTKERLLDKFKTVLDPEYRMKVKLLSKAWRDRPTSALDTAVHWTEFAARYRNLTFRSAAADVPIYQYLCLDILLVLVLTPIITCLCLLYIFRLYFSKNNTKNLKKSKKS